MKTEFLKWSDQYALGIEKIDEQHKKLLDIINKIYNAFIERDEEQVIGEAINEMTEYTDYHFKTEEQIFRQYGYEKTDEHIKEHQHYVEKINQFKKDYTKGHKITYSVMNFLRNWILEHIQKTDKEYVGFFKANNIV